MKKNIILALSVVFLVAFYACSEKNNSLVGTWQCDSAYVKNFDDSIANKLFEQSVAQIEQQIEMLESEAATIPDSLKVFYDAELAQIKENKDAFTVNELKENILGMVGMLKGNKFVFNENKTGKEISAAINNQPEQSDEISWDFKNDTLYITSNPGMKSSLFVSKLTDKDLVVEIISPEDHEFRIVLELQKQ